MTKEKECEMFYTHILIPAILLRWLTRPEALRKSLEENDFYFSKRFRVTALLRDNEGNYFLSIPSETIYGSSIFKITPWIPSNSTEKRIRDTESISMSFDGQLFRLPKEVEFDPLEYGSLMVEMKAPFLILGWVGKTDRKIVAKITKLGLKEPD